VDMDISMDIHEKSVDMDMDMDVIFHIHGNPESFAPLETSLHKQLSCPLTFAPVAYLWLLRRLVRAAVL